MKPVAALQGAALVRGHFLGRTGWAKRGRAVHGLSHPMMPPQQAPLLLGKGGHGGLALVGQSDGLRMKHVVFSPSSSWAARRKLV